MLRTVHRQLATNARRENSSHLKSLENLISSHKKASTGEIFARGAGLFGALGTGNLRDAKEFEHVPWPDPKERPVKLAAGWGHSAAITENGQLIVWGRPYDFQNLMRINTIRRMSSTVARWVSSSSNSALFGNNAAEVAMNFLDTPTLMDGVEDVVDISLGAGLTVGLRQNGSVFCFGQNRWKQCGIPSEEMSHVYNPNTVNRLPPCVKVQAGLQHCVALSATGEVYTWGKAGRGQLGLGSMVDVSATPSLVQLVNPEGKIRIRAVDIAAGFTFSAALGEDGNVYVWGKGMGESLSDSKLSKEITVADDAWSPRCVVLPEGRKVKDLVTSNFTVVMRANDDSLWAFGPGEHDRNANPNPLRVSNDWHPVADRNNFPTDIDPKNPPNIYANLPSSQFRLVRGHQRVTVLSNQPHYNWLRTLDGENPPETNNFSVVVHGGEAYLLASELEEPSYNVLDYVSGWQHSMVLLKDPPRE